MYVVLGILVLVAAVAIALAWHVLKKGGEIPRKKLSRAEGIALGIAMCSGIGMPLAASTGNWGLMGIGIPIGVAVGIAMSGDKQEDTPETRGRLAIVAALLVVLALAGLAVFAFFLLR